MGCDCPPCSGHDSEHKRFRLPGRHDTFFANGQAFALSRVKTFTQLHLLSFDPTKVIKVSQCVRGLYGMECNRSSEVKPCNNMPSALLQTLLLYYPTHRD